MGYKLKKMKCGNLVCTVNSGFWIQQFKQTCLNIETVFTHFSPNNKKSVENNTLRFNIKLSSLIKQRSLFLIFTVSQPL